MSEGKNEMNTISFPNMFNKNKNDVMTSLSYNYESINESIKSLLSTNPGELLGDPLYGCGLKQKLFDLKTNANISELKNIIQNDIQKYVPGIVISDIKIYSSENDNKYKITINYRLKQSYDSETFETVL